MCAQEQPVYSTLSLYVGGVSLLKDLCVYNAHTHDFSFQSQYRLSTRLVVNVHVDSYICMGIFINPGILLYVMCSATV